MISKSIALLGVLAAFVAAAASAVETSPEVLTSQILMRNAFSFSNGRDFRGGSAFLLKLDKGVFAVTVEYILKDDEGKLSVKPSEVNATSHGWSFYVPGTSDSTMQADRLATTADDGDERIALSLRDPHAFSRITPLLPAITPPKRGDILYILACPQDSSTCHQAVHRLRFVDSRGLDMLAEPLDDPKDWGGFGGAPVIDKDGRVVGVALGILSTGNWKGDFTFCSVAGLDAKIKL